MGGILLFEEGGQRDNRIFFKSLYVMNWDKCNFSAKQHSLCFPLQHQDKTVKYVLRKQRIIDKVIVFNNLGGNVYSCTLFPWTRLLKNVPTYFGDTRYNQ